jgi:hypothetical protein
MADSNETHVPLFEQVKTILNPLLEKMNQDIPLTRAEITVMFNTCDYCQVDYDSFISWFFSDDE